MTFPILGGKAAYAAMDDALRELFKLPMAETPDGAPNWFENLEFVSAKSSGDRELSRFLGVPEARLRGYAGGTISPTEALQFRVVEAAPRAIPKGRAVSRITTPPMKLQFAGTIRWSDDVKTYGPGTRGYLTRRVYEKEGTRLIMAWHEQDAIALQKATRDLRLFEYGDLGDNFGYLYTDITFQWVEF
jgi:hypothetical protein